MKKLLSIAETCYVVAGFLFLTGALFVGGNERTSGLIPDFIRSSLLYSIWTTSVLLLILNAKRTLFTMSRDWVLWILSLMIMFSFVWSEYPSWTLLNNREFAQMSCFGLYFATRFNLRQQVKLIALTLGVGAIASTFFALVTPAIGVHTFDHPGAWKGIYDYKNTFGSMMVMFCLACFALPIDHPRDRWFKWGGMVYATILILLSTSKTSLVVLLALMAALIFYRSFQWRGKRSVAFVSVGVLVVAFAAVVLSLTWVELVALLGKDATFSGRTYIWQVALDHLWDHPWFGFGRSAFWSPESPYPKAISYYLSQNFNAPHAHNGFIDLALDVGLVGFALFWFCYITAFAAALKRAYASRQPENFWPLGFLMFLVMNNLTESYLLRLANIYWILFIATVMTVKQRLPIEDSPTPVLAPRQLPFGQEQS